MAGTIERLGDRAEPRREVAGATGPLLTEAREYIWLDDFRNGMSTEAIAVREGVSSRRVRSGLQRARARERASCTRDSRGRDTLRERDRGGAPSPGSTARSPGRWGWESPLKLVPFFPIGAFTPRSTCPHRGPIRPGSSLCCMVCSRSGVDDHPELKRDPRTDPRPEPKAAPPARPVATRETRKQRRKRLFMSAPLDADPHPAVAV